MPGRNCWEYYVFDVDPDDDNMEKELNKIGADCWEIGAVFPEDGIIIFKRTTDVIPYTGEGTRRKRPDRKIDK